MAAALQAYAWIQDANGLLLVNEIVHGRSIST